ncbi:MAG: 3D domain-containing protein [Atribacterota bacterium]
MKSKNKDIIFFNFIIRLIFSLFITFFLLSLPAEANVYIVKDQKGNVVRVTNQYQMLKKEKDAGYTITILIEDKKETTSQFKKYNFKEKIDWERSRAAARIIEEKLKNKTEKELDYPVYQVLATAYTPDELSCAPYADGYTATGYPAGYGSIAIDPDYGMFQFGDVLYVEGYGIGVADDVGSAIKGKHIDVCFNMGEIEKAYNWGRQNVRVWKIE